RVLFRSQCDVLSSFESLRRRVDRRLDLVTMIDVIEHIPAAARPHLLREVRTLLTAGGVLALTYPSPFYQRYLAEHDPAERQPVDEEIASDVLIAEAANAGLLLHSFALVDMDYTAQYVHCVFSASAELVPVQRTRSYSPVAMASALLHRRVLVPLRRRRFVTRVFGPDGRK